MSFTVWPWPATTVHTSCAPGLSIDPDTRCPADNERTASGRDAAHVTTYDPVADPLPSTTTRYCPSAPNCTRPKSAHTDTG